MLPPYGETVFPINCEHAGKWFVVSVLIFCFVTSPWAQLSTSACRSAMSVRLHTLLIICLSFTQGWGLTQGQEHTHRLKDTRWYWYLYWLKMEFVTLRSLTVSYLISFSCRFIVCSGCMYPSHHWGEWNDSQLLPTIQKLMKGYNRYLRPNFNGRNELNNGLFRPK